MFRCVPPIYTYSWTLQTEAQSYAILYTYYIIRDGDGDGLKLTNYVRIVGCVFAPRTLQLHMAINVWNAYNDGVREIPDRNQSRKNTISKTTQTGTEKTNKDMNNEY